MCRWWCGIWWLAHINLKFIFRFALRNQPHLGRCFRFGTRCVVAIIMSILKSKYKSTVTIQFVFSQLKSMCIAQHNNINIETVRTLSRNSKKYTTECWIIELMPDAAHTHTIVLRTYWHSVAPAYVRTKAPMCQAPGTQLVGTGNVATFLNPSREPLWVHFLCSRLHQRRQRRYTRVNTHTHTLHADAKKCRQIRYAVVHSRASPNLRFTA